GAGNSDDINLDILAKSDNHITISDIDKNALIKAKNNYQLPDGSVRLLPMDYSGLANEPKWDLMVNHLIQVDSIKGVDAWIHSIRNKIQAHVFSKKIKQKFDLVIVSPIYTQLLYPQLMTGITMLGTLNYPHELMDHLRTSFLDLMQITISHFNNSLVRLLNKNGIAIVMSDIFEAGLKSPAYELLHEAIAAKSSMDQYYLDYNEKYGFGFGDYGLYDLSTKLRQSDYQWFEWPFSTENHLFVKLVNFRKEKV
ncbi:MAG: hypothetical protein JXL85_03420, partial [Bacilli bacterium]|nr:hypothetical protein [Bacilli bacterium]